MMIEKNYSCIRNSQQLKEVRFETELRLRYSRLRLQEKYPFLSSLCDAKGNLKRMRIAYESVTSYYYSMKKAIRIVCQLLSMIFSK